MQTEPSRAGGAIPRLFFYPPRRHLLPVSAGLLMAILLVGAAVVAAEQEAPPAARVGRASWYGAAFHRRPTASGARFDLHRMTCAHRTLPLGSTARATTLVNGRPVLVTSTDRGPFRRHRDIGLSPGAAPVPAMA